MESLSQSQPIQILLTYFDITSIYLYSEKYKGRNQITFIPKLLVFYAKVEEVT